MISKEYPPLITIGITCYNAEKSILRAINSAVEQDWENKEIIVVDDYSTDCSRDVIINRISSIPNARLIIHERNKRAAGSRNTIIDNARGDYIAFFDDDDESLKNRIRLQYEAVVDYYARSGHLKVACFASGKRCYPNGYVKDLLAVGSKERVPQGIEIVDYLLLYNKKRGVFYGTGTPSCSLFISTDLIKSVNGFDEDLGRVEDSDLAIRLGLNGAHFIGTKEMVFIQYATQGEDKTAIKNLKAETQLAEKYEDYLSSINMYYYAKWWPLLRYYHFKRKYIHLIMVLLRLFCNYPLRTFRHFFKTAPQRLIHEFKMR